MSKQTAAETVGESNRDWDGHYKQGAEALPWDAPAPAPELVSFIESAESVPRKVLEVGCGTGTNAIYLASKGCDVVATDISPTAIEMAKKKCRPRPKGAVELKVSDILAASPVSSGSVDFVFDRGVFSRDVTYPTCQIHSTRLRCARAKWFLVVPRGFSR